MNSNRRRFLQTSLLGTAAVAAGGVPRVLAEGEKPRNGSDTLRILVLGGTGFIGPHMVREALRRGHVVSLFNRGKTNNTLFPDLELLVGDRDNGLHALKGGKWDAVVDNSGFVPRHVADSARLLSPAVTHYLFISSISAYASFVKPNHEDSPLATMPDETVEEVTGETYGPMKALCEQRATAEIGEDRLTILRPTYICGPGDQTDRFSYWPVRTMKGGEMLWPGVPDDKIQIIDVRDLANFVVDSLEQHITGTFNTVTPAGSCSMGDLLADSMAVTATEVTPTWLSAEFIEERQLGENRSLPIWAPPTGEYAGVSLVNGERAAAKGLRNRPIRETARDLISWWKTLPEERTQNIRAGLSPEREAELLALWHEQS
ncbi:MAG: NAD-dependent epimerase/dehydratase family protein [Proteobacteria bacterium]|nr:NAD-dependent epimerase/dehydratase family protein [Pseudomonadota bacterium]